MKDLGDILKGMLLEALPSTLFLAFLVFALKDVYYNGFEPRYLKPYDDFIYGGLGVYAAFVVMLTALGGLFILRSKNSQVLLGFLLSALLNFFYIAYFAFFLRDYLN